jgi:predicted nuclease of predicted toxin-antitoxin system
MSGRLLLDEMFPPLLAETLRERGHDVVAIVERPEGRGLPDPQVLDLAVAERRCLLTENVRDFEILRAQRLHGGHPCAGLLYSGPHRFPRTKTAIGRLITALDGLLSEERLPVPGQVDWLV